MSNLFTILIGLTLLFHSRGNQRSATEMAALLSKLLAKSQDGIINRIQVSGQNLMANQISPPLNILFIYYRLKNWIVLREMVPGVAH